MSIIDDFLIYAQSGNFKPLNLMADIHTTMAKRRIINRPGNA